MATPVASGKPTVETDQWRARKWDILTLSHVSLELPSWPGWKSSQKKQSSIAAVLGTTMVPSICHVACSPRARPYHLHHVYNQPQETATPGRQQPNSVPGLQPGDPKLEQR